MVSRVEPALLHQEAGDALRLLVQLAAREGLRDGALAVEQGEEDVVRRRLRPPPQDLGYELIPVNEIQNGVNKIVTGSNPRLIFSNILHQSLNINCPLSSCLSKSILWVTK